MFKVVTELKIKIRPETEKDYAQIAAVVTAAFGRAVESRLVDKLRLKKEYIPELSLLAEHELEIIGHILFFPVNIRLKGDRLVTLSLAPLAVHPNFQNRGVGSRLAEEGLALARKLGFRSVIVVGHPTYYPRFGFRRASEWGLKLNVKAPDEAFMGIELAPKGLGESGGTAELPQEYLDCE